jgi:hypothetical protein
MIMCVCVCVCVFVFAVSGGERRAAAGTENWVIQLLQAEGTVYHMC